MSPRVRSSSRKQVDASPEWTVVRSIRRPRTSSPPTAMCTRKWSIRFAHFAPIARHCGRADWHFRCSCAACATGNNPTHMSLPRHGPGHRGSPLREANMMRYQWLAVVLVCSAGVFLPTAAHAQQTVNLDVGYFTVRGQDARVEGDVLNANRNFLTFDVDDFNGASIGGEWL